MQNRRNWTGMLVMVLVFGMTAIGCDNGSTSSDPTYSIRVATMSYTDFLTIAQELDPEFTGIEDQHWASIQFTVMEYNQLISLYNSSSQLSNKNQYNWTKSQLIDYFTDGGFSDYVANKAASFVVTTTRSFIFSRSDPSVYMLLR